MPKHGVTEFLNTLDSDFGILARIETDLWITVDESGNITRANPAFEKALGRPESEVLGHHFIIYIHPRDLEIFLHTFFEPLPSKIFNFMRAGHGLYVVRLVAYHFEPTPTGQRGFFIFRPAIEHSDLADWVKFRQWSK